MTDDKGKVQSGHREDQTKADAIKHLEDCKGFILVTVDAKGKFFAMHAAEGRLYEYALLAAMELGLENYKDLLQAQRLVVLDE